jgi:cytochrome P450
MFLSKRTFHAGLKEMDKFIEPYITQALSLSQSELEAKLEKSDTFIHALARFTRDRKVIRDQLVAVLLAGRDTTASTLSWVFLELGRNPQVVAKLGKHTTGWGL